MHSNQNGISGDEEVERIFCSNSLTITWRYFRSSLRDRSAIGYVLGTSEHRTTSCGAEMVHLRLKSVTGRRADRMGRSPGVTLYLFFRYFHLEP